MTADEEKTGKPVNDDKMVGLEFPEPEKLRVYGDFMFLTLRSPHHRKMSVANLQSAVETPISLKQFRVFRFNDIPRGLLTWAMFDAEAERKYISGALLQAEDWRSGPHMWLIDFVAPYKGLTKSMARWIMEKGNLAEDEFWFRRVKNGLDTGRIVHVDFNKPDDKAEILDRDHF
ncbi:MAG: toxin-activating lysine-acyltransferase [Paracoccaceae bacterium]